MTMRIPRGLSALLLALSGLVSSCGGGADSANLSANAPAQTPSAQVATSPSPVADSGASPASPPAPSALGSAPSEASLAAVSQYATADNPVSAFKLAAPTPDSLQGASRLNSALKGATASNLSAQNTIQNTTTPVGNIGQNGWWWNPTEGGRGYAIERQGNQIFIGAFLYEPSGAPVWYVSTLKQQPDGAYTGDLTRYAGGQTLLGAFKPTTSTVGVASAALYFNSATTASLFIAQGGGSRTIPIERFPIKSVARPASNAGFETGWYVNEAEGGRGYFVEVQGNDAFIASFMYAPSGEPTWYVSNATLTGTTELSGTLEQYSGGQSLLGAFRLAGISGTAGVMKFSFPTSTSANMTLPSNNVVPLTRFWFNTPTSLLANRAWTGGFLIEQDDNPVRGRQTSIDDQGRTISVFLKSNGTREVLYAVRGTPNGPGVLPSFSAPVAIDLVGGVPRNNSTAFSFRFGVESSPSGNSVAWWRTTEPCTAATYFTSGDCRYFYTSRFFEGSGTWETPVRATDSPGDNFIVKINNNADVSVLVDGWLRSGTNSYVNRWAIIWRPASSPTYTRQVFSDVPLVNAGFDMDSAGNMLLAAEATQNSTTDIVAYRGSLQGGFGANQVLDTRSSAARLDRVAAGSGGQQVVTWAQNDGANDAIFAATSPSPTGAWTNKALVQNTFTSQRYLRVSDDGVIRFIETSNSFRFTWRNGVWGGLERTPRIGFGSECAVTRNGDTLCVDGCGKWETYDASRNVYARSADSTDFLGIRNQCYGLSGFNLSISGIGAGDALSPFDVLPTSSAPSGDRRNSITNLWGWYLK